MKKNTKKNTPKITPPQEASLNRVRIVEARLTELEQLLSSTREAIVEQAGRVGGDIGTLKGLMSGTIQAARASFETQDEINANLAKHIVHLEEDVASLEEDVEELEAAVGETDRVLPGNQALVNRSHFEQLNELQGFLNVERVPFWQWNPEMGEFEPAYVLKPITSVYAPKPCSSIDDMVQTGVWVLTVSP